MRPTQNEAMNMLFMYEHVFRVCVKRDFKADISTEVYGFPAHTPLKRVQESCNKTFRHLIWMKTNKWPEKDLYTFTVQSHRFITDV